MRMNKKYLDFKMNDNIKYTSFCGLYCKDCIPSNNELFATIDKLKDLLDELGFAHYAKFKSTRIKAFESYGAFREMLTEIKKLKCETNCFEGPVSEYGCNENCDMRRCVIAKKIAGCWECDEYKVCRKLEPHKKFHPGMEHNLNMIKEFDIENWLDKKGKHYIWDK
jgi:hypothetical protein